MVGWPVPPTSQATPFHLSDYETADFLGIILHQDFLLATLAGGQRPKLVNSAEAVQTFIGRNAYQKLQKGMLQPAWIDDGGDERRMMMDEMMESRNRYRNVNLRRQLFLPLFGLFSFALAS
jgi:hypothetical protein